MRHDFDRDDKADCNGDGIMSYKPRPDEEDLIEKAWSECSIRDLKEWFTQQGFDCKTMEYGKNFFWLVGDEFPLALIFRALSHSRFDHPLLEMWLPC